MPPEILALLGKVAEALAPSDAKLVINLLKKGYKANKTAILKKYAPPLAKAFVKGASGTKKKLHANTYAELVKTYTREQKKLGNLIDVQNELFSKGVPLTATPDFQTSNIQFEDLRLTTKGKFYKRDLRQAIKSMREFTNFRKGGFTSSSNNYAFNSILEYLEKNGMTVIFESSEEKATAMNEPENSLLGYYVGEINQSRRSFIQKRHPEWFYRR